MERVADGLSLTSRTFPRASLDEILAVARPFSPEGHYLYPADREGNHVRGFIAVEPIARHGPFVGRIADDVAAWARAESIDADVVFAPAQPAVRVLGGAVARALDLEAAYWEYRPSGRYGERLVEGTVKPGSWALVFNGVSLQGRCVGDRLPAFLDRLGGSVAGAAVFAKGTAPLIHKVEQRLGSRFYSTVQVDVTIYRPAACPMCAASGAPPVPWTDFAEGVRT